MLAAVDEVVKDWEDTEEMVASSNDISRLLHSRGINIRYLGLVYSNAKVVLVRKVCMA